MSPNDILDSIRPINPSAFGMTREQAMMMQQQQGQGGMPPPPQGGMPPPQGGQSARWVGHECVFSAESRRY